MQSDKIPFLFSAVQTNPVSSFEFYLLNPWLVNKSLILLHFPQFAPVVHLIFLFLSHLSSFSLASTYRHFVANKETSVFHCHINALKWAH